MTRHAGIVRIRVAAVALAVAACGAAHAGCKINLTLKNTGRGPVVVKSSDNAQGSSAVKSRNGLWTWIGLSSTPIQPGGQAHSVQSLTFGCGAKRRYRIIYECADGTQRTQYFPAVDKWTTQQDYTMSIDRCR
ncbi:MAG: hypothetical protein R3E48_22490 [Burkholderiaceae bacterium]